MHCCYTLLSIKVRQTKSHSENYKLDNTVLLVIQNSDKLHTFVVLSHALNTHFLMIYLKMTFLPILIYTF